MQPACSTAWSGRRSTGGTYGPICAADDTTHCIKAGRSYERLALQATALDLRSAFISQPVEVVALCQQFAMFLESALNGPTSWAGSDAGEMPRTCSRYGCATMARSCLLPKR
jgi:hypothetical protein